MSKFIDKLNKIVKGEITSIGFRRVSSESEKKRMQLAVCVNEPGTAAEADAVLLDVSGKLSAAALKKMPADTCWGACLKEGGPDEVKKLEEAGCDFIVVPMDFAMNCCGSEQTGKVIEVDADLTDSLLRTFIHLPADAIMISVGEADKPFSWRDLMAVSRFGSIPGKPLFLKTASSLTSAEIEKLWQAGCNAIVTEGSTGELMAAIEKADYSPKKKKGDQQVMVRQANGVDFDDDDEEQDDEDDD